MTEWERDGVENGDEEYRKEHRVEKPEMDWVASLSINISSAHLGNLFGNYVVEVSDKFAIQRGPWHWGAYISYEASKLFR